MRTGGWIQAISQNNRNKLWNHPKSCSRSENRPLIYSISSSICGKTMKNNDSKFNQKPVPLIELSL